ERMLDGIVDRLMRALLVDRAAVLLESPDAPHTFVPACVSGMPAPSASTFGFLKHAGAEPPIFFETEVQGLHYFIPCRAKDRVIAYLALGRTRNGDYLTREDIELLEAVSDYVGIALENALLYRSLEQKATEYQNLKDFSENIVESINVGVLV